MFPFLFQNTHIFAIFIIIQSNLTIEFVFQLFTALGLSTIVIPCCQYINNQLIIRVRNK